MAYIKQIFCRLPEQPENVFFMVYNCPSLEDVRAYCNEQVSALWEEVTRFENPHKYYVDFSGKLWGVKQALIEKITRCSESEEQ